MDDDRMPLPDPIERGETACDDWFWLTRVGDKNRCGCGRLFKLEEGETASPDPYAIPVCPTCFAGGEEHSNV